MLFYFAAELPVPIGGDERFSGVDAGGVWFVTGALPTFRLARIETTFALSGLVFANSWN
jgi:hypothetical protein